MTIYLIGGAPRVGKSTLCQQIAAKLQIGWISTDLLIEVLRAKQVTGIKNEWDASPEAISASAEWSFPYIERFIWGVNSMSDGYVIEGVDFLPIHVNQLSQQYPIRAIFLGCSQMSLEIFDQYPGKSKGYANLPDETRLHFSHDIPHWSEFIKQEAERWHYPYIDMSEDFPACLVKAEKTLLAK